MNKRENCVVCGKAFWNVCGYNANRRNLTCGSQDCRRIQKTRQQTIRRRAKRAARLEAEALRKALGKRKRRRKAGKP